MCACRDNDSTLSEAARRRKARTVEDGPSGLESHPKYSITLQTDVRAAHNNVANVQISIDDDVAIIIDGHAADGYARS
jgi:hypothetical protein